MGGCPQGQQVLAVLSKIKKEQAGKYRLRATNAGGHIDSDAVDVVVFYAPVLTTNIASKSSVNETESLTLTVAADVLDSKGTDATHNMVQGQEGAQGRRHCQRGQNRRAHHNRGHSLDSGSYWCEIKNGVGTTKSTSSKLTVLLKLTPASP